MTTPVPPPPYSQQPPLPGQGPRPPRPSTVTYGGYALIAIAVLFLINGVFSVLTADTVKKATDEYLAKQGQQNNFSINPFISLVVDIVIAAAFAGVAYGVLRGAQAARIIAWVLSGLSLCCAGFTALSAVGPVAKYLPGGVVAFTVTAGVLLLLLSIAAIVLLALPKSHPYFRTAQQPY